VIDFDFSGMITISYLGFELYYGITGQVHFYSQIRGGPSLIGFLHGNKLFS